MSPLDLVLGSGRRWSSPRRCRPGPSPNASPACSGAARSTAGYGTAKSDHRTASQTARPLDAGTLHELQAHAIRAAAEGVLEPLITRYALNRASDAHADLENRHTAGKIVPTP